MWRSTAVQPLMATNDCLSLRATVGPDPLLSFAVREAMSALSLNLPSTAYDNGLAFLWEITHSTFLKGYISRSVAAPVLPSLVVAECPDDSPNLLYRRTTNEKSIGHADQHNVSFLRRFSRR